MCNVHSLTRFPESLNFAGSRENLHAVEGSGWVRGQRGCVGDVERGAVACERIGECGPGAIDEIGGAFNAIGLAGETRE